MARASRHYIPGFIWHIPHRCHKREFLLRFRKDRHRWAQWLYQARKRYDLEILNYNVTSNHDHLLVKDTAGRKSIPRSMQLVAGRTGQEYNQRKQMGMRRDKERGKPASAMLVGEHCGGKRKVYRKYSGSLG